MTPLLDIDFPILVTGAAGAVGAIGRSVTEMLLAQGHKVRAMVRREDARAEGLRRLGAEVVVGDLTDLASVHCAVEGCKRIYFGMSVSAAYLEATVNIAAVARHHGVEAIVNISQMTITQMSITETTDSPQHKLHWLAEQALAWSGLPVVTMRPTVFLEGFFLAAAATGVRDSDALVLPLGGGRTAPISAVDVALAVALVLDEPAAHIGRIYNLTGPESTDLTHFAKIFSEVLGREIIYRDVPVDAWIGRMRDAGLPAHLLAHLAAMARLHQQGRYDRMTDDFTRLTGRAPMSMREFVEAHAAEFTRAAATA
ncbi:NAD(P)H-binding protein [Cupriavidus sp. WKF15]|uniref:NmrA family NAD(P)-binding protein n=1 Tax=Cupriavidus sp. WKF15 TaxID=3032282 RepID=UPI0023E2BA55|nr:NAD(P)H-binding protein [Cupriavidus sp. WKF15]WER50307.1 NAD(P)H-binding protein [Cupriavidus sp. WKF15]